MFPIHAIHVTWITVKHHGQMFSLKFFGTQLLVNSIRGGCI